MILFIGLYGLKLDTFRRTFKYFFLPQLKYCIPKSTKHNDQAILTNPSLLKNKQTNKNFIHDGRIQQLSI